MARGQFRLQQRSAVAGRSLGQRILEECVTYCLGVLLPEGLVLASDATMRSNLSVDAPIDLLRYRADSFSSRNFATLEGDATYWMALR